MSRSCRAAETEITRTSDEDGDVMMMMMMDERTLNVNRSTATGCRAAFFAFDIIQPGQSSLRETVHVVVMCWCVGVHSMNGNVRRNRFQ